MKETIWHQKDKKEIVSLFEEAARPEDVRTIRVALLNDIHDTTFDISTNNEEFIKRIKEEFNLVVPTTKNTPIFYYLDQEKNKRAKQFTGAHDREKKAGILFGNEEYGLFRSSVIGFASALLEDFYHPIHASIAYIKGKGIAFTGEHMAGKSTSLHYFIEAVRKSDFQVLTDDWGIVRSLEGKLIAQSIDPTLALNKDLIEKFPHLETSYNKHKGPHNKVYLNPNVVFWPGAFIPLIELDTIVLLESEKSEMDLIAPITPKEAAERIVEATCHMPDCYSSLTQEQLFFWESMLSKKSLYLFNTRYGKDVKSTYWTLQEKIFNA